VPGRGGQPAIASCGRQKPVLGANLPQLAPCGGVAWGTGTRQEEQAASQKDQRDSRTIAGVRQKAKAETAQKLTGSSLLNTKEKGGQKKRCDARIGGGTPQIKGRLVVKRKGMEMRVGGVKKGKTTAVGRENPPRTPRGFANLAPRKKKDLGREKQLRTNG